jgi:hypothetical protein
VIKKNASESTSAQRGVERADGHESDFIAKNHPTREPLYSKAPVVSPEKQLRKKQKVSQTLPANEGGRNSSLKVCKFNTTLTHNHAKEVI